MYVGLFLAGAIVAFVYSFFVGANDGANILGVTVGVGALAPIPATAMLVMFQALGSFVGGNEAAEKAREKYLRVEMFEGDETSLMLGLIAALVSGCFVLFIMTYRKVPVSTTHAIATPLVFLALTKQGSDAVKWEDVIQIFIGWAASPCTGAIFAFIIDRILSRTVLIANTSEKRARYILPIIFGVTLFVFPIYVASTVSESFSESRTIIFISLVLSGLSIAISAIYYQNLVDLSMRISPLIEQSVVLVSHHVLKYGSSYDLNRKVDRLGAERVFCILQLLAGSLFSFCHGANDISNSIGPFAVLYDIYETNKADNDLGTIHVWIPFLLGTGMMMGVFFSKGVTMTVASSITRLTPSGGFVALFSAAVVVLIANFVSVRISLTQAIVGSVIGVGFSRSRKERVNWVIIQRIVAHWILIFPLSFSVFMPIFTFLLGLRDIIERNKL